MQQGTDGNSSDSSTGKPYATKSAAGNAAARTFFPLGYREGFSQWVLPRSQHSFFSHRY